MPPRTLTVANGALRCGGRRLRLFGRGAGPVGRTLGVLVAVDELDHRHCGAVAVPETGLEDTGVAPCPLLVARADGLEELLHAGEAADLGDRLPARMKVAAFGQRH